MIEQQQQLELGFSRRRGLAFCVSPRKVGMKARRELHARVKSGLTRNLFGLRRHVERVALLGELQQQYHRAQRYAKDKRLNRTPEGRQVRKQINQLALQVVGETSRLCV